MKKVQPDDDLFATADARSGASIGSEASVASESVRLIDSPLVTETAGRRFGSNRYTFELTPVPAYERFVKQVRNVNSLGSDEEKDELRTTLAEHRDEILNAEIDQIPEILDYRRWFRFQLKVLTETN